MKYCKFKVTELKEILNVIYKHVGLYPTDDLIIELKIERRIKSEILARGLSV
jgi:hypothetical protein